VVAGERGSCFRADLRPYREPEEPRSSGAREVS